MFDGSLDKRDEIDGLRTEKQIALYRLREAAKHDRARRWETEARVRHLKLELGVRLVLLGLTVAGWFVAIFGAPADPTLAKLGYIVAGVWTAVAAWLIRALRPKRTDEIQREEE